MPLIGLIVKIHGMGSPDNKIDRYPVPVPEMADPWRTELTIRKSLFVTRVFRCESAAIAKNFIMELREKEPDATHHCWACQSGAPGDTAKIGFSDDGEPHGTAGRPMLNVLLHSGLGQICAVTSRWFGGIKLGTGGLVRAYQDSVLENLKTLPIAEMVEKGLCALETNYEWLDGIKRVLPEFEATVLEEKYTEMARLTLIMPVCKMKGFEERLAYLSNGKVGLARLATSVIQN